MRDSLLSSQRELSDIAGEAQAGEVRYRTILATMADGLIIIDAKGRITDFNSAAERRILHEVKVRRGANPDPALLLEP